MLLGNPQIFALKYTNEEKLESHPKDIFGKSLVYIQGVPIGHWDENNLLGVLLNQLGGVANMYETESEVLKNASEEELKALFMDVDNYPENGLSLCWLGENFDCYQMACFKKNDAITFIWRLHPESFNQFREIDTNYSLDDYPINIKMGSVPTSYLQETVSKFDDIMRSTW